MAKQSSAPIDNYKEMFSATKKYFPTQENITQQNIRQSALQQLHNLSTNQNIITANAQPIKLQQLYLTNPTPAMPLTISRAKHNLDHCQFNIPAGYVLYFANGFYAPCLEQSPPCEQTRPFSFANLATIWSSSNHKITRFTQPLITDKTSLWQTINQCFSVDGAYINIPENTTIELPIIILHITNSTQANYMIHPKNYIMVGKNSKVQLLEIYINNSTSQLLNNAQTEIYLADNAYLTHTILQQSTINDVQRLEIHAKQNTSSQLNTQIFGYGGNENQTMLHTELAGKDAVCNINALEYTKSSEQHSLDLQVKHNHTNSASEICIRSILDNNSSCAMHGKILVTKQAAKTKAKLQHKTILLSEQAKIDSQPQLAIYNDDVICSHGSTIGSLDPNALIYMNARGISTMEAKQLLLQSFVAPIIDAIPCISIKQHLRQLFFPGAKLC